MILQAGHTPGGLCLLYGGVLLTGDHLAVTRREGHLAGFTRYAQDWQEQVASTFPFPLHPLSLSLWGSLSLGGLSPWGVSLWSLSLLGFLTLLGVWRAQVASTEALFATRRFRAVLPYSHSHSHSLPLSHSLTLTHSLSHSLSRSLTLRCCPGTGARCCWRARRPWRRRSVSVSSGCAPSNKRCKKSYPSSAERFIFDPRRKIKCETTSFPVWASQPGWRGFRAVLPGHGRPLLLESEEAMEPQKRLCLQWMRAQ